MAGFRARIRERQTLLGAIVTLGAPQISELFALAGFDWLWIDLEHAPLSLEQAQQHIQAVGGRAGTLLRVPWNDPVHIKQALDLGCDGVIVPQVRTADEARQAVSAAKYPPEGIRSVGIARAQRYGMSLQDCVTRANEEIAVLVQIEHIDALPNMEEILAVPGVDAIVVGPYDLSASMGRPGEFSHPDVASVIESVAASCNRHAIPWGAFASDVKAATAYTARGATILALGMDTLYLWKGAQAALGEIRKSV